MNQQDERDYAEEAHNRDLCPECDCSPCISGQRGHCIEQEVTITRESCDKCGPYVAATVQAEFADGAKLTFCGHCARVFGSKFPVLSPIN